MFRISVLVVLLATAASGAVGDPHPEPPPPAEIGFSEAVGLASSVPEVVGRTRGIEALREARRELPSGWSPLALRLMPQLGVGTPSGPGLRLALEQPIPLASRRAAARATLDATTAMHVAEARARTFEARQAIGEAWIASWAANAERTRARDAVTIARSIVERSLRGRAAGAFTELELAEVRALAAEAKVAALDAEGRSVDAAFALGAALGGRVPRTAGAVLPEITIPDRAVSTDVVARLPAVAMRRLAAVAARARGAEAHAVRTSELLVGAELVADPGGDRRGALTLGFTLPHERGERERGEARAEALRQDGEAEAEAGRAQIAIERAFHDVEHGRELAAMIEGDLLPVLDDAARRRHRGFELGETTVLEVLAGERAALAARRAAIEARAQLAWAQAQLALWLADGGSL